MTTTIPTLPDNAPSFGGRWSRLFGRLCLKALGWRLTGEMPAYSKVVLVGAPHSSNWDFVLSMCCSLACGVKLSYLMKKEAFVWPLKGLFLYLGGIPVDRKASQDIVPQITHWIKTSDKVWIAITPEGTRSAVKHWKTGAARIAWEAQIPLVLVGWDYPKKTITIGMQWQPTGDANADTEKMKAYVTEHFTGKNPAKSP
jgi:1-acyl-sn-glycerol-3-phosphate acyltransferase